eukprot:9469102-Pyramimonas_sp.AAC.1
MTSWRCPPSDCTAVGAAQGGGGGVGAAPVVARNVAGRVLVVTLRKLTQRLPIAWHLGVGIEILRLQVLGYLDNQEHRPASSPPFSYAITLRGKSDCRVAGPSGPMD